MYLEGVYGSGGWYSAPRLDHISAHYLSHKPARNIATDGVTEPRGDTYTQGPTHPTSVKVLFKESPLNLLFIAIQALLFTLLLSWFVSENPKVDKINRILKVLLFCPS